MPAEPRWLLAIPDAIAQLEALDRDLLTRRDLEQLFGVSKTRAAGLMRWLNSKKKSGLRLVPLVAKRKLPLLLKTRASVNVPPDATGEPATAARVVAVPLPAIR